MHFLRPVSVFSISILLSVAGALPAPATAPTPATGVADFSDRDLSSLRLTGCDLSKAVLPKSGGKQKSPPPPFTPQLTST